MSREMGNDDRGIDVSEEMREMASSPRSRERVMSRMRPTPKRISRQAISKPMPDVPPVRTTPRLEKRVTGWPGAGRRSRSRLS